MASSTERMSAEIQLPIAPTIIRRRAGIFDLDLPSLWASRELMLFLVWRDIKGRYAQSVLGIGWSIIQPLFSMLVFTVVFGRLAKIGSDGLPYVLFSYTGLVAWTYFSNAMTGATDSLIGAVSIIQKVYFPRLIIPVVPVVGKLLDFAISFLLLIGFLVWYQIVPTIWALFLPVLILIMMMTATGAGMFLTALGIQYRDVRHGMRFLIQLGMYAAPVVYPASLIPEKYLYWYALNPMVGVIEGFRASLLGSRPMPWDLIGLGSLTAVFLFFGGIFYFRNKEPHFADVA